MATERHGRNNISSLISDDGAFVTEHPDKENLIFQTYENRMGTTSQPPMIFDLASLSQPTDGLEDLSVPFTSQEIDEVIKSMPVDKATGPDGFNGLAHY
jgi:hypothetical protein